MKNVPIYDNEVILEFLINYIMIFISSSQKKSIIVLHFIKKNYVLKYTYISERNSYRKRYISL